MERNIIIKTSFPALHSWKECFIHDKAYLKNTHRHRFHVVMKVPIEHNDRDIEFISLQETVESYIRGNYMERDLGETSCEMIAEELLREFHACYVSVMEDDENGAEIFLSKNETFI